MQATKSLTQIGLLPVVLLHWRSASAQAAQGPVRTCATEAFVDNSALKAAESTMAATTQEAGGREGRVIGVPGNGSS